jgi:hypothetical protein
MPALCRGETCDAFPVRTDASQKRWTRGQTPSSGNTGSLGSSSSRLELAPRLGDAQVCLEIRLDVGTAEGNLRKGIDGKDGLLKRGADPTNGLMDVRVFL